MNDANNDVNKFTVKLLKNMYPFGKIGDIITVCYWYAEEERAVNDRTDFYHCLTLHEKYPTNNIDASSAEFVDWVNMDG